MIFADSETTYCIPSMGILEAAAGIFPEMRREGNEHPGGGEAECSYHLGAYAHPCQAALAA